MSRWKHFLLLLCCLVAVSCDKRVRKPSVVIVVADSLGASDLACYGSPDTNAPFLDALARRGLQFRQCVTQAPWDLPGLATLLTGRFPSDHGANLPGRDVAPGVALLTEALTTFRRTAAFSGDSILGERFGLHRGFDHLDVAPGRTGPETMNAALSWLGAVRGPLFFLVHLPGDASEVNREIGRLLRALDSAGRGDDTFVLATATHGGSPDLDVGRQRVEVPLILSAPKWIPGELRTDPAMLVDVYPTTLQCLGLAPVSLPGRGLLGNDRSERALWSELTWLPDPRAGDDSPGPRHQRTVQRGRWKLVRDGVRSSWALYDLEEDPAEVVDVAASFPEVVAELSQLFPEGGTFEVPETDLVP